MHCIIPVFNVCVCVCVCVFMQKMPEEQAFSVLVKIMFTYGQRDLFKSNFKDLHLMFYQLDRLLEVCATHCSSSSSSACIYNKQSGLF